MRRPKFVVMLLRSLRMVVLVCMAGSLFLALPLWGKLVVDFDPNLDFSKYKTYAFIGGVENLVSIRLNPELIDVRLHRSVSRELDKRGLHEVNPQEHPDLVVRYWANAYTQMDVAVAGDWGPYGAYV